MGKWTRDEVNQLRDFIEMDLDIRETARIMRRTISSVYNKIKRLDLPRDNRFWTIGELETLINLYRDNCSVEDISKKVKRSIPAVRHKIALMKDWKQLPKKNPPKYSKGVMNQLSHWFEQGYTLSETFGAIHKKVTYKTVRRYYGIWKDLRECD